MCLFSNAHVSSRGNSSNEFIDLKIEEAFDVFIASIMTTNNSLEQSLRSKATLINEKHSASALRRQRERE